MTKLKCKTTGDTVTVQPSLAEPGFWLVTYTVDGYRSQLLHTLEEIGEWYENN